MKRFRFLLILIFLCGNPCNIYAMDNGLSLADLQEQKECIVTLTFVCCVFCLDSIFSSCNRRKGDWPSHRQGSSEGSVSQQPGVLMGGVRRRPLSSSEGEVFLGASQDT